MVPDGRLRVATSKRSPERLEVTWIGGIQYPATYALATTLRRPIGAPYRIALDEAMFCGLQMDGVFVPYMMQWSATIERDDPRLRPPASSHTERGPIEHLFSLAQTLTR